MNTMVRAVSYLVFPGLAIACGKGEPPPKTAEAPPEIESSPDDQVQVASELGGMNEQKVSRVFEDSTPGLKQCLHAGAERVEYLGGDVGFFVEVDSSGTPSTVFIQQSTLGDRATEKCMRDVLKSKKWPKPVGGEKGHAQRSVSFDPPKDVRPPVDWSSEDIREGLAKLNDRLDACKQGEPGSFAVTMYVDTSGKPLSAGVVAPSVQAEAKADCLVDVLLGGRFASPGSWAAKVSFQL
jgi:hypothetical protein